MPGATPTSPAPHAARATHGAGDGRVGGRGGAGRGGGTEVRGSVGSRDVAYATSRATCAFVATWPRATCRRATGHQGDAARFRATRRRGAEAWRAGRTRCDARRRDEAAARARGARYGRDDGGDPRDVAPASAPRPGRRGIYDVVCDLRLRRDAASPARRRAPSPSTSRRRDNPVGKRAPQEPRRTPQGPHPFAVDTADRSRTPLRRGPGAAG